jgi:ribosome-binding factor A
MSEIRIQRVTAQIRDEIGIMILRGVVKDPRVNSSLSITEVKLSKDFSSAKIYISSFGSPKELEKGIEGLNNAAGFIQSRLARHLNTRNTPKLVFFPDHSIEYGTEMIKKLGEMDL